MKRTLADSAAMKRVRILKILGGFWQPDAPRLPKHFKPDVTVYSGPPRIVVTTSSAAASMTETVPVMPLPTQTSEPSGVTATDAGRRPTGTSARCLRPVAS